MKDQSPMIADQVIQEPKKKLTIRCEVCHNEAKFKPIIRHLGTKFGVICKDCAEQFSDKELDLIANIFLAYGGYFNKFQTSKEERYRLLKQIAKEYSKKEKRGVKLENDIKLIHKALLHGISLTQLINGVKLLIQLNLIK